MKISKKKLKEALRPVVKEILVKEILQEFDKIYDDGRKEVRDWKKETTPNAVTPDEDLKEKERYDALVNDIVDNVERRLREQDSKYQEFFKKTLEKFGVGSPNELSDEKKKEFFNYIDKNWKSSKD